MRMRATSLFGVLAAGLILLTMLAAGGAHRPAAQRADAAAAAAEFVAGSDHLAVDLGSHRACGAAVGCSACVGTHCTCFPGGVVPPGMADLAAPGASGPERTAAALPGTGLAKSPDERPPRLA